MRFFGKKESKKSCCGSCTLEVMNEAENTKREKGIKILGSGCAKCEALEENVKKALNEQHVNVTIEHITDFAKIASYGVMTTPALVWDGKVVSYGKVLSVDEVKAIYHKIERER